MTPDTAERIAKLLATDLKSHLAARLAELRELDGYCRNCLSQLSLATLGTLLADCALSTLGSADGAVYIADVAAMVAEHEETAAH
jgi:hypothetical protein